MMKTIVFLIFAFILCSCTNSKDANNALKSLGFKDIRITGFDFFACSKDDFFHTGFIATNAQGQTVKGTVCSGIFFKNSTVRFK